MLKNSLSVLVAFFMLLPHLILVNSAKSEIIDGERVTSEEEQSVFAFVQIKVKPMHVHDYGLFKPHVCTAFPITPTLFLTAAHCIVDPEYYSLSLTNGTNASKQNFTAVSTTPQTMLAHPTFMGQDFNGTEEERTQYDIAFIKTSYPVDSKLVLRLPDFKTPTSYPLKTDDKVKLVGYGLSTYDTHPVWGESVAVKRKSTMSVGEVLGGWFFISGMNKNVAPGDSGGPVILSTPKGDTVVGIISGMLEPEGPNPRGIYNRLTRENLCWVQTNSGENLGLDCVP